MTVRDYLEATSENSARRSSLLLNVEAIIHKMGYDWDTLPKDQWVEVYKQFTNLSPQMVKQYDGLIRSYYTWLDQQHILALPLSPYQRMEIEQVSEIFAHQNLRKYLSTVDDLIALADNLQDQKRVTEKAKFLNKACLVFIWVGLQLDDLVSLSESDIAFFDDNDSLLSAPEDSSMIAKILIMSNDKADSKVLFTIANKKIINIIYLLWKEAHQYRLDNHLSCAPLLIAENAGKRAGEKISLNSQSLNMRIGRVIKAINKANNLDLSMRSIRLSAMYHAAYTHWKLYKLPWAYTPNFSGILMDFLKRDNNAPTSIQQIEFQKFLEYARNVKNDSLER